VADFDIWRTANILLKRYRGEAVLIATKRADALLDQGDCAGCSAWIKIVRVITELERKELRAGDVGALSFFNFTHPVWLSCGSERLDCRRGKLQKVILLSLAEIPNRRGRNLWGA